jgi:hypothetical protein
LFFGTEQQDDNKLFHSSNKGTTRRGIHNLPLKKSIQVVIRFLQNLFKQEAKYYVLRSTI